MTSWSVDYKEALFC